jgi:signal transduction histidine kinase
MRPWGAEIIYGTGNDLFNIYAFIVALIVIGLLIKKYFRVRQKEKLKIQYFLIGTFLFVLFNIIFNIIIPSLSSETFSQYYQFGDYSAIFLLIFTAYAITKHNLLGIKTLLTQTLIVVITIILLLDIFALSDNLTMQILKIGIIIAFLYFSRGMIESVKKEKQAREELQKTYRKVNRYAKKLEKANLDLEELLEVKNNFLHITSHQLRTPLTVIRGMLAMWKAGDFDGLSEKDKEKMKEKIYLSAERLNNITNDMLDAMEVEGKFLKFNLETVSLEDVIKEAMEELRINYDRKGLYLKLNIKGKSPKIKVESKYLKQALMNLLDNAEKYTLRGGVEINVYPKVSKDDKKNKFVLIEIKDTGIGINKRDQKKLFQKFSRTGSGVKQNTTGSGLGLFIAKEIVDEHNGEIEISSEGAGKGTTIKVWLPKN